MVSRAVSRLKKAEAWNWTPMRRSSLGLRGQGARPSSSIRPSSGLRIPSRISSVVVFPAPFGPRIP